MTKRNELETVIAGYEGTFEEIQNLLDDSGRSPRERLAAIADLLASEVGDDEDEDG